MAASAGRRSAGEVLLCTLLGVVRSRSSPNLMSRLFEPTRGPLLRDPSSIDNCSASGDSNISPSCDSSETLPHKNASSPDDGFGAAVDPTPEGSAFGRRHTLSSQRRAPYHSFIERHPLQWRLAFGAASRCCPSPSSRCECVSVAVHSSPRVSGRLVGSTRCRSASPEQGVAVRLAPAILGVPGDRVHRAWLLLWLVDPTVRTTDGKPSGRGEGDLRHGLHRPRGRAADDDRLAHQHCRRRQPRPRGAARRHRRRPRVLLAAPVVGVAGRDAFHHDVRHGRGPRRLLRPGRRRSSRARSSTAGAPSTTRPSSRRSSPACRAT